MNEFNRTSLAAEIITWRKNSGRVGKGLIKAMQTNVKYSRSVITRLIDVLMFL